MQTVKAFVNIAPHIRERQPKAVEQIHKQLCIPTDKLRKLEIAMSSSPDVQRVREISEQE
jgi:hypothetical protein